MILNPGTRRDFCFYVTEQVEKLMVILRYGRSNKEQSS